MARGGIHDYGRPMKPFFIEVPNLWAWADKFLGYFRPNYQHPFWYNESIVLVFIFNHYLNKSLYITSQTFFGDWDLNLGRKELGIHPSCVRSPWTKQLF